MKQKYKRKINESKSWFFEKINKVDKPLARLTELKRHRSPKSAVKRSDIINQLYKT